jgi:UDP-N-acetylmuramyl tripeptide synthase
MYKTSITIAKVVKLFINILGIGSGYTWSGQVALITHPNILKEHQLFPKKGLIFVSGTNGKTTTVKMLVHLLQKNGYKVTTNSSGANLLNGIVAALALDTSIFGIAHSDYGVFEVDEFTLPSVLKQVSPDYLFLLNLSRDQLDRYGETDIILDRWLNSVHSLSVDTKVFLNKNQPEFAQIKEAFKGRVILSEATSSDFVEEFAPFINISLEDARKSLSNFQPAWGRGEVIKHNNFTWKICLAKNPASFDTNLDSCGAETFLFIFNDNIPDGRDVSWIYDISTEKLKAACYGKNIYVSGKRAFDMAVRLQYAGISIDKSKVIPNVQEAVLFVENGCGCKEAVAFPNYSSMLELRKILLGRSIL